MLQDELLAWFKKEQRDLPWRRTYDPYQVWISEIMLQQTQVSTVLPYFKRFISAVPNVSALAKVTDEVLLKLWEGLGYYSRARNLQKAACIIMKKHGGVFPSEYEAILALPGVGRYTAGAISSIAFEQNKPVVDGNVIRVLSRVDAFDGEVKKHLDHFWKRAEDLLPKGEARHFNQALMELGALICTPKNPKCSICPLQKYCKALSNGLIETLPNKSPTQAKVKIQVAIAILEKDGMIFIQKRHQKGLMAGLWEFPGGKVEPGESTQEALRREVMEETGLRLKNIRFFTKLQHAYTRYLVDLHCFIAEPVGTVSKLTAATEARWVRPEDLKAMAFPAANVKIIESYLASLVV